MPVRCLVATTNPNKLHEIGELLTGLPVEFATLADYHGTPAPEETGATFDENARLKARYYADATGLLTIAEDSGLAIDALDGAPGVHSARFGGEGSSYPEKFRLIYEQLREAGVSGSRARFVCAVAVADRTGFPFETQGVVEGEISPEPRGTGGFGYDPIFFYPPFGCTLAEAGARKSSVSHRGAAFRQLRQWLARMTP